MFRRARLSVVVQRFRVPGRGRSRNVIGEYDGPSSCLHVVMAHTDSTPALVATGAEKRVFTGSPDHLGARALARRVRDRERRPLRWALSLDEVGRDRPFWLRSPRAAPRPGVEGVLVRAARRAGAPVTWMRDEGTGNSDHREFELLGLPAAKLGVGSGGEPCRPSPCDRPRRLDPASLRLARRIVESALRAGV